MLIKRIYDKADLERYKAEQETAVQEARAKLKELGAPQDSAFDALVQKMVEEKKIPMPKLDYISLAHTGTSPEQNFSIGLVTEGLQSKLMEISGDELTFHVYPEDLHYEILRKPGRYCTHCGEKLENDNGGEMARLHVAQMHAGKPSPDANNPAGYQAINYFECVLDAKQHAKYRKQGHPVVNHFPLKEEA